MSLANSVWAMPPTGGVTSITVSFGPNQATAGTGGNGKYIAVYQSTGTITNDILWIEKPDGEFMFQFKGPTTNKELPTYTGRHSGGSAKGWYSNFDAAWGAMDFTMTKKP